MEQNLADRSYHYLKNKLAAGELSSGDQLVNRSLAAEIGVSVVPVREAITRLANEGLVDRIPGAGAFVRKTDRQDLDNLYVLRDALESAAASEAARFITEDELEELESIVDEAEQLRDDIAGQSRGYATKRQLNAWLDQEQLFHELLIDASRNPLLAKVTREYRAIGEIFDAQRNSPKVLDDEVAKETCLGKRELIEALKRRDARHARDLMSAQIQRGRKSVLRQLRRR
jgi:DNA-binding GntR family transcriptional regulator